MLKGSLAKRDMLYIFLNNVWDLRVTREGGGWKKSNFGVTSFMDKPLGVNAKR